MTPFQGCFLSKAEYRSALRAEHGTLRRFLAGCRCPLCDRPSHHHFAKSDALDSRASVQQSLEGHWPGGPHSTVETRPAGGSLRTTCSGHTPGVGIG